MSRLLKCTVCGKYTLEKIHCDMESVAVRPPKWNADDKYGRYRRLAKGIENLTS